MSTARADALLELKSAAAGLEAACLAASTIDALDKGVRAIGEVYRRAAGPRPRRRRT